MIKTETSLFESIRLINLDDDDVLHGMYIASFIYSKNGLWNV